MELIHGLIDFVLHIDVHLAALSAQYGVWLYGILFLIVFAETGLVVTPFLPGDSLLFAAGTLCSVGSLDVGTLIVVIVIAALCGDNTNYFIGSRFGKRLFQTKSRFLNARHLEKTEQFYEKHGAKTIVLARFMPIVRTFAPFVAGIGTMTYRSFLTFSIIGAIIWSVSFSFLGFFFAQQPLVKKNFTLVIGAIIVISLLPALIEITRSKLAANKSPK